jgi:hypothetical protein
MHSPLPLFPSLLSDAFPSLYKIRRSHISSPQQQPKEKKRKKNGSLRRRRRRNKSILFSVMRSPSVAFSRHFFKISPPCSD